MQGMMVIIGPILREPPPHCRDPGIHYAPPRIIGWHDDEPRTAPDPAARRGPWHRSVYHVAPSPHSPVHRPAFFLPWGARPALEDLRSGFLSASRQPGVGFARGARARRRGSPGKGRSAPPRPLAASDTAGDTDGPAPGTALAALYRVVGTPLWAGGSCIAQRCAPGVYPGRTRDCRAVRRVSDAPAQPCGTTRL